MTNMRHILKITGGVLLASAIAILPATEAHARKTLWQILFPYNAPPSEPPPSKTLQAPFADPVADGKPETDGQDPLHPLYDYKNGGQGETTGLDKVHRSPEEIADWLERAVSDVLNIAADNFETHMRLLKTGMNETALNDFTAFIQSSNMLDNLRSHRMRLAGVVDATPLLLNEGVVAGRYRWLFELPVTASYMPAHVTSYGKLEPVTQRVTVTVQVGRVARGQGFDEMIIESFKIRSADAATP